MVRVQITLLLFIFIVTFYQKISFAVAVHSLEQKSSKLQVPKTVVPKLPNDEINKIVNSLWHALKSVKNPDQRIEEILDTQITHKHVAKLDAGDRKKIIEDVVSKLTNLNRSAQSKLDLRVEKLNSETSQTTSFSEKNTEESFIRLEQNGQAKTQEYDNQETKQKLIEAQSAIESLEAEKQCLLKKLESVNNQINAHSNNQSDAPQTETNLLLSRGYEKIPLTCPMFSLKELTPKMPAFQMITTYVTNSNYDFATSQNRNGAYKVDIIKIYSVHFKKERNVHFKNKTDGELNRYLLFHGTKVDNVNPILRDGFLLDPNRVANGAKHGTGIYFADRACFAGGYSCHPNDGVNGVIFLSEVALGKQFVDNGDVIAPGADNHAHLTLENLPENADSIFGPGKYIPAKKGLYEDGIVVPSGKTIVSDTSRENNYNEYVIFSKTQVQVRFIIYANIAYMPF